MRKDETLCDLRFVKAEYEISNPPDGLPDNRFRIKILPVGEQSHTFVFAERNGEQFAAELDVLAAVIRAKAMQTYL